MSEHQSILSDAEREALSNLQVPELAAQRVLIVDDDPDTCDILGQILDMHGIGFICADDAQKALEQVLSNRSIGLLLTDLRMAPFDGLELIKRIRASERASLPVVIMSGDAGVRDAIAAMHLSVVDFLLKPIDAMHLMKLVHKELGLQL